ncbi:MAG: sulfur carrier protein ThiS [Alkaliphilus sp.]
MIKVNNKNFDWQEGLTVARLLELKKYTFPKLIVKINSELIKKEEYETTQISDGDDVKVIHLLAGG